MEYYQKNDDVVKLQLVTNQLIEQPTHQNLVNQLKILNVESDLEKILLLIKANNNDIEEVAKQITPKTFNNHQKGLIQTIVALIANNNDIKPVVEISILISLIQSIQMMNDRLYLQSFNEIASLIERFEAYLLKYHPDLKSFKELDERLSLTMFEQIQTILFVGCKLLLKQNKLDLTRALALFDMIKPYESNQYLILILESVLTYWATGNHKLLDQKLEEVIKQPNDLYFDIIAFGFIEVTVDYFDLSLTKARLKMMVDYIQEDHLKNVINSYILKYMEDQEKIMELN